MFFSFLRKRSVLFAFSSQAKRTKETISINSLRLSIKKYLFSDDLCLNPINVC